MLLGASPDFRRQLPSIRRFLNLHHKYMSFGASRATILYRWHPYSDCLEDGSRSFHFQATHPLAHERFTFTALQLHEFPISTLHVAEVL